jgi:hypothetical protein
MSQGHGSAAGVGSQDTVKLITAAARAMKRALKIPEYVTKSLLR